MPYHVNGWHGSAENITSPPAIETRKGIVEILLINHPLDCPICDQAGECDLQNIRLTTALLKLKRYEDLIAAPLRRLISAIKYNCT